MNMLDEAHSYFFLECIFNQFLISLGDMWSNKSDAINRL